MRASGGSGGTPRYSLDPRSLTGPSLGEGRVYGRGPGGPAAAPRHTRRVRGGGLPTAGEGAARTARRGSACSPHGAGRGRGAAHKADIRNANTEMGSKEKHEADRDRDAVAGGFLRATQQRPGRAGGDPERAREAPAAPASNPGRRSWDRLTHTFLPSVRGLLTNPDHVLGHKTRLNKLRRIQVTQIMFFDHKELNYKSITESALETPQIFGI